jgi:hypothetical protein
LTAEEVAHRLAKPRRTGSGWTACCPAHEDSDPSLSISDGEKGVVVKCHAGCSQENVLSALEFMGVEIRRPKVNGNGHAHHEEFNLAILAAAKKLPVEFLTECFVHDEPGCVAFEYLDAMGAPYRTKYRRALTGNRGFSTSGGKMVPYGLWRMEQMMANDARLIICEGETDALTLWHHGFSALGISGADGWKEEFCGSIPEGAKVFVALDADEGGKKFEESFRASKLAPRVHFIRMREDAKDPSVLHCCGPDHFIEAWEDRMAVAEPAVKPKERRIVLRDIMEMLADESEPEWLIEDTLEQNVIALMVGARGSLKSFVAIDWMMRAVVEGHGAVALSAEGSGFGRRIQAWKRTFAPRVDPATLHVKSFERSISLCVPDVLAELQEVIGELSWRPRLLIVDTLSKYSAGLDENENSEVRDFLERLSESLRNVFGCTILLVAHTGYAASDRIRGASSFGANTESEYIVTRPSPTDFVCKVSRERFKDSPPLEPVCYQGEVVDLGRVDKRGRAVTSLILRAGASLPDAKPKVTGANQRKAITALTEWLRTHPTADHITTMDIGDILKAQGISRQRKPEVLNSLVNARIITPSIGGFSIDRNAI